MAEDFPDFTTEQTLILARFAWHLMQYEPARYAMAMDEFKGFSSDEWMWLLELMGSRAMREGNDLH